MIRALLPVLLLAACAAPPPAPTSRGSVGEMTTMRLLALANCPERLKDAKAIVVLGAGAGAAPRDFIVTAHTENPNAGAILMKAAETTPETLVLEIRASSIAPSPGEMTFREPVSGQPYGAVRFRCRGAEIFRVDGVEISR